MSSAASDPFGELSDPGDGPIDDGPVDDGPVFGRRRRRFIRVAVLVALIGMLLPLVLSAFSVARSAAERACAVYVADFDADAAGARVEFDLFAEGGPGWLCDAVGGGGGRTFLGNLGPMPAAPRPAVPGERDA